MFSEEKVAQMAAYLLSKDGGRMAYLKLMKLLYLSDRKSFEMFGNPISGDRYVSMDKGPVLARTYSLIIEGGNPDQGWEKWIRSEKDHVVALRSHLEDIYDLEQLSQANIEAMDVVFEEYGHWDRFKLCDETHRICPEWQDPEGSSIPIPVNDIFRALGKSQDEAALLSQKIEMFDRLVRETTILR